MIDIHSHILPGIDDGAQDMDTSLEMLRIAQREGTKTIFATPHYYKGYFETKYEDVLNLVHQLQQLAKENKIDIEILPGQEILLDQHVFKALKQGHIKTLNNTKYMLVEFPMDELPEYAMDIIYELGIMNIVPIIAHPERYKYIIKKPRIMNEMAQEGCLFQINSGSIMGIFGKDVQKTSELLLKHRLCHFIATDAHTIRNRCPGLKNVLDNMTRKHKELLCILNNNVESLIQNSNINQEYEKIKDKRIIFNIFGR